MTESRRDPLARLAARLPPAGAARLDGYRPEVMRRALGRELRRRGIAAARAGAWIGALAPDAAEQFFEALLLPVSEFFRDPAAFAELDAALPARPLRILCAPCATGEEAYSLAALCTHRSRRGSRVLAADLHAPALAVARAALYPAPAARKLDARQRGLLFAPLESRIPEGWLAIDAALVESVDFRRLDLLARFPSGPFDLVACRNLLIYLAPAAQRALLADCAAALAPGGLLLLGGAERLPDGPGALGLETVGRHKLYRRAIHSEVA